MGSKVFDQANCVRAFLCEAVETEGPNEMVTELRANLDDMTGEALGYAMERLLAAGALDVSFTPVQMKKQRPGILLTVMCKPAHADRLAVEILRHTSTFGVRGVDCRRYAMEVEREAVETPYGPIHRKTGKGYGVEKGKWEYEDVAAAAKAAGVSMAQVLSELPER